MNARKSITQPRTLRGVWSAFGALITWLAIGCGDSSSDGANKPAAAEAVGGESAPVPVTATTQIVAASATDTDGAGALSDGSGTSDSDAVDPTAGSPVDARGPCKIRWSDGRSLQFTYKDNGVAISLDHDSDGNADECGSFTVDGEGRPTKIAVDQDCNGKTDFTLTPKYDGPVASASFRAEGKSQALTLVALPAFGGVLPGYPLMARRSAVRIAQKDGLVQTAEVRKPASGKPIKVRFHYAQDGRVTKIEEDLDIDGRIDHEFIYNRSEAGTLTSITRKVSSPQPQRHTARIDYGCWK